MLESPQETVKQIIEQNKRCGINHLILQFHWVGTPQSLVLESMTRFAEEVRPLVEQGPWQKGAGADMFQTLGLTAGFALKHIGPGSFLFDVDLGGY